MNDHPLARIRKARGKQYSQEYVAAQISQLTGEDIGQAAVSYWELGKVDFRKVHPRRLRAYATVLGITTWELAQMADFNHDTVFLDGHTKPIPSGLDAFLQEFSRHPAFPELRDPAWHDTLREARFHTRAPERTSDWLEYFLLLRRIQHTTP